MMSPVWIKTVAVFLMLLFMVPTLFHTEAYAAETKGDIFFFSQVLKFGSQNNAVRQLQESLKSDSSIYPEGLVTGYFGRMTELAVKRFQAKYGIVASGDAATTGYGRIGPRTNAMLNKVFGTQKMVFPPSSEPIPSMMNLFAATTTAVAQTHDCSTAQDEMSSDSCWQARAVAEKDVSLCERIKITSPFVSRDTCLNVVVQQSQKGAALCAMIVDERIKKNCEDTTQ